jgi:hypothetical protein
MKMDIETLKLMSEKELVLMLVQMKACREPEENINAVVKEIASRKPAQNERIVMTDPKTAHDDDPVFTTIPMN